MPILTFDDARHSYHLDGKPVPSVTKVISNISEDLMLSTPFIRKTVIGTNVHRICEKINNGERVNIAALSEDVSSYVQGYISFLEAGEYTVEASELRVYSAKYRYAGTLDILARDKKGRRVIMDIKTSALVSPTTALQLSAYEHAYREMEGIKKSEKIGRICIWLTGDGGYELIHYKDPGDYNVYICKLVAFNWDRKVGLK